MSDAEIIENQASFREISGWLTRKPGKTGQFSLTATSFLLLFGNHAVGRRWIWPLSRVTVDRFPGCREFGLVFWTILAADYLSVKV
jgi:hypothetical protein